MLVEGSTRLLCVTGQDRAGRFTSVATNWTQIENPVMPPLSYDIGAVLPGTSASSTLQAISGRAPAGTTEVVVQMADSRTTRAAVTDGLYVALVNTTALPQRITALDASGTAIASLTNPGQMPRK